MSADTSASTLDASVPGSRDVGSLPPDTKPKDKRYIADIVLEGPAEGRIPFLMSGKAFSTETDTREALPIEQNSAGYWIHDGIVALTNELVFFVTWNGTEKFNYIDFKKLDFDGLGLEPGSGSNKQITLTFRENSYGHVWQLKFKVYTIPMDNNAGDNVNIMLYGDLQTLMGKDPEKVFNTIKGLPDDMTSKSRCLNACGRYFVESFRSTRQEFDMDNCLLAYELAMQLTQDDETMFASFAEDTGLAFLERYSTTSSLSDITQAISNFKKAVELTPEDHPKQPFLLNSLGVSLQNRFERFENLADISEAIMYQRRAMDLIPENYVNQHIWPNNLGTSLRDRFDQEGDLSDISEAITCLRKAVDRVPDGHSDVPLCLSNLGGVLLSRFQTAGELFDISEAITFQRRSVDLTPEGDANLPPRLTFLGSTLLRRYEKVGDLTDISESIKYTQQGILLAPDNHENLPIWLSNLGLALLNRFELLGNSADLSEAIKCQRKTVSIMPKDHAELPICLNNLGTSLLFRFEQLGDLTDVTEAIKHQEEAISLTPEGETKLPMFLNNLGLSLQSRFQQSGDVTDVSEAVAFLKKAVYLAPDDHFVLPMCLSNLGLALSRRFERVGDLIDISEAITYQRKAIDLVPQGHKDLPTWLNNLGLSLKHRFERVGDISDISDAITHLRQAVYLGSEGHSQHPNLLNNLGLALQSRFQQVGDVAEISEAISYQEKAMNLIPEGNADLAMCLNNLGASLQYRFKVVRNVTDISKAITYQKEAILLAREGHSALPSWLNNLGLSLRLRFEEGGNLSDNESATSYFWQAATYSSGPPSQRLVGAQSWIKCSRDAPPPQVLKAHDTVISLISQMAGLEQTIQKRHRNLVDIADLSSSAAATAFQLDRPDLALTWLEQGRCLVWTQLNSLRAPIDALRSKSPLLAERILTVSRDLETAGYRNESSAPTFQTNMLQDVARENETMRHLKLAQEWDQLLSTIRAIPEFQDFLRPLAYNTLLRNLPSYGTVIVINTQQDRSDALALTSNGQDALHIPLPAFSYANAIHLRHQLTHHLRSVGVRMRNSDTGGRALRYKSNGRGGIGLKDILKELWNLVVKPILDRLGYTEPPSELSRIWWCATGPLAFLPLHAAGLYDGLNAGKKCTVSDFAISSYTPTVRALIDRVKSPRRIEERKTGLFIISQPNTPKMAPIPGTTEEARAIGELLEKQNIQALCLEGEAATVEEGIKNMEKHTCIHFACHASQENDEPLTSGFALHDGRLELSKIIKEQLSGADLAFLSACQTSTGDEKLSEEAVHLAAGMLAAGYRSVVATMWSIQDRHGPKIARDFYENLLEQGAGELNGDNAARALHYASQNLRRSLGDSESALLDWVPYVHFGL